MTAPALPEPSNPNQLLALLLQLRGQQQDQQQFEGRQAQQAQQFNASSRQQQNQFETTHARQQTEFNRQLSNAERQQLFNELQVITGTLNQLPEEARAAYMETQREFFTPEKLVAIGQLAQSLPQTLDAFRRNAAQAGYDAMSPEARAVPENEAAHTAMTGGMGFGQAMGSQLEGMIAGEGAMDTEGQRLQSAIRLRGRPTEQQEISNQFAGQQLINERIRMLEAATDRNALATLSANAGMSTEESLEILDRMHARYKVFGDVPANGAAGVSPAARQLAASEYLMLARALGIRIPPGVTEKALMDDEDGSAFAELNAAIAQYQMIGIPLAPPTTQAPSASPLRAPGPPAQPQQLPSSGQMLQQLQQMPTTPPMNWMGGRP